MVMHRRDVSCLRPQDSHRAQVRGSAEPHALSQNMDVLSQNMDVLTAIFVDIYKKCFSNIKHEGFKNSKFYNVATAVLPVCCRIPPSI